MPKLIIDLLRHGQCEGGDIFRGDIDVALTQEGYLTMSERIDQQGDKGWARIITSPKQRCRLFSQALAHDLNIPIHIEHDLREIHFGDWEGQDILHIWQTQQTQMQQWSQDPSLATPPNGETFSDFTQRVSATMTRLTQEFDGEHILIVTHGGIIRLLLSLNQSLPPTQIRSFNVAYGHFEQLAWII